MNKAFLVTGFTIVCAYAILANAYFLNMAFKIRDDIRKSGQHMESDPLSSLSWNTSFWDEAAALCDNQDLLKVLDHRMPVFIIWCFLAASLFVANILLS